ncbi:hypothetical protein, partial [Burkholderia pseudomallei]|uniref:hypothetical protein n=1 Tax=Burkholderia pseudomallei TaxID=28450 RepID=UPI001E308119
AALRCGPSFVRRARRRPAARAISPSRGAGPFARRGGKGRVKKSGRKRVRERGRGKGLVKEAREVRGKDVEDPAREDSVSGFGKRFFKYLSDGFASDALTHPAVVRSKMADAAQRTIGLRGPRRAGARNTM